jgi:large repetitive protein
MCDAAPTQVTAQVFQADGLTPVSALLVEDTDFSVTFAGAPDCTLRITMLSEAAAVTAGNRMIVRYQAQLDADSQTNATFTNIAGATEWFSADPSSPQTAGQSVTYTRVLTDGTVGLLDHEDAHTVNVPALRFEKTVANVTTSLNPAVEATPGDRLRYSLRVTNLGDAALSNFSVRDEIDRLNASAAFVPGTLTLVAVPSGADTSNTSATGGAKGTGLLDVRNLTLAAAGSLLLEFEVTLAPVLANSSDVLNQSQLLASGAVLALSDDPNINGAADPGIAEDEDPTRIRIVSAPDFRVLKTSTDLTGDPAVLLAGETLRYTITVQNVGTDNSVDAILRDQVPVNTTYVAGSTTLNGAPLADTAGLSPLVNGLLLNSPANATPGAMPAGAAGPQSNVATDHFRRRHRSDGRRRHGDFEPGLRQQSCRWYHGPAFG